MTLTQVFRKILSVTLICAFVMQQTGFVWAANVDNWADLKTKVEGVSGEYNVTTALTADEGSPAGTILVAGDGSSVTGAALTENTTHNALFNIPNSVTFGLGNNISGSIVNDGTLDYSGASLADGSITGSGRLNFSGTSVTNANTINQDFVYVAETSTLTNNGSIAATTFVNNGTVNNEALISANISNWGTLNTAVDALHDADGVFNAESIILNASGTNINNAAINGTLDSSVKFSGDATITNKGAISGGSVENDATTLQNNAILAAEITNNSGKTLISNAGNLQGEVHNNGSLSLAGGSVQDNIDGSGNLAITTAALTNTHDITQNALEANKDFTNSGDVSLTNLETSAGVTVTNTKNITVSTEVTNAGTIANESGATFDNSASTGLFTNAGSITNAGTFNTNDMYNTGSIANAGTFSAKTLQNGGNLANDATVNVVNFTNNDTVTGSGTYFITGDSTNYWSITQGLVVISNDATFNNNGMLLAEVINVSGSTVNTDPDNLGEDVTNNGELNFIAKGTLSVAVTDDGETNIEKDLDNQGSISQKTINIQSGAVVTSNASDMTASDTETGIANAGTINYTGGSTANKITGDGRIDIIGYVTNTGDITQKTVSNSGIFTNNGTVTANLTNTNAIEGTTGNLVTQNGVSSNAGTIEQANLTNNGTFDNTGHITLTGALTNNKTFNTNADLIAAAGGIANAATGNLNIVGGTNTNVITGEGTTNFSNTVTNNVAITQGTVTNSGILTNNALITAAVTNTGTLTSKGTDIAGAVANTGTYVISVGNNANAIIGAGGKLSILGDTANTGTIKQETLAIANTGSLTTDSSLVTATITNDGKLEWNAGTANENIINGSGSLEITGGTIANSASINQGTITITDGSLSSNADLLTSVAGITNNAANGLTLTGGANTNVISGSTGSMATSGDVTNNAAITQVSLTNSGTLTNNALITAAVANTGTLTSKGTDIAGAVANTGTYAITDGNNANNITGTGGKVQILGNTTNTGTITQDDISINTGATLVASNITNVTVANAIDNAGTLEMQFGTNSNKITGSTGTLKVTDNVINNSGAGIIQDNINIATLGTFEAYASNLFAINGITNSGTLKLNDGLNINSISGTGDLTIIGSVNNYGNISQDSLVNTGTLSSDAGLLAFANGVLNNAALDLTGGINNNAISGVGSGTVTFSGNVTNNGIIGNQTSVSNTATLTNNAAITADDVINSGTLDNSALITATNAITNTGTINSTADNLNGAVTNNNILNLAGGTTQAAISGMGIMNITDDLTNDFTIAQATVNNSANMTNNGTITAAFNNTGTVDNNAAINGAIINTGILDSTADNLNGAVTNNGTLNVEGGTTQNTISGTGDMNILADLQADYNITQDTVTNNANLTNNAVINVTTVTNNGTATNNATITATDIVNNGTIRGAAGNLIASNEIANAGTLVFDALSTGASNISGTGDVQVTTDTTLTGTNTFTGGTLIDGADLTVAGQTQLGTGDVTFTNNGLLVLTGAGALDNNLLGLNATTDNIYVDNAVALTLNGSIDNALDFYKDGAGTMTFAMASNGYMGDTYVDGGMLIGNTANINNAVIGLAGTTVEFNDTTDAELNEINTLGNFVQSGSAVLNVKNNGFTAAQVDINAGTFAANRAITASILNVNTGATLRGNGNITGDVNVNTGATLAPGNSVDTLTITGDLNLASGSTTAMEINETPASDKIVVTGATNIASGANLTVTNENGRYFEWKSFDLLESAGNVTGTFTYDGTVANYDASRIDIELDYSDPTKVTLTAKRKATNNATAAENLSRNERETAYAMDSVSTGFGGDITNALLQLELLGGLNPTGVTPINGASTLKSALANLDGVLYANSALATLFNAKTAHVYDRIAKRNPSAGKCPTCHDNVWAEYYSQYDKVYANDNSPRFTNNMTGVLVGYDRSSDEVLLGVYAGGGKSDLRQHSDRMDIEDTSLGIYAGYMPGNWVFKGTLFGGYQTYVGKRNIDFMARSTRGKYHGMNVALDLEGGYQVALYDWLNLKPFVGVLGNYAHMESFTETGAGALNLHVESKNQFNTQARLGVELDGKIGQKFNWYGSAAVKQFIGGDYAKLHMSLGLPGTRMEIISAELGRTYFSGQVGASYALTNHWSLFGNVEAGVNNKSANCYGNVGLAYTW